MFTDEELDTIDKFLGTLETCEYMGIAPRFSQETFDELVSIRYRILHQLG